MKIIKDKILQSAEGATMNIVKMDDYRITFYDDKPKVIGATTNHTKTYWIPTTLEGVERLLRAYPHITELQELRNKLDDELFMSQFPTCFCLDTKLRPYQREAVDRIAKNKSFGLFMEQRTGKTPTAVVAMKELNVDKIIVSVPNGLQTAWKRAFETFAGRIDTTIVKGTPLKRQEKYKEFAEATRGILIGSYDTLARDANAGLIKSEYDYIILDEAHFLRNNTIRTKGNLKLRQHAKHALALTGTPATSNAHDVIPIIMFLHPKAFSKWGLIEYFFSTVRTQFAQEIAGIQYGKEVEWAQFLNRYSTIIKQRQVMDWLPEIEKVDVVIEMEDKQRTAFKKMLNEFRLENSQGQVMHRAENHLVQMMRLIQLGLDPRILHVDVAGAKTKWIKEWLADNKDEPVLVWSNSKEYLNILEKELQAFNPLVMTGDTKKELRQGIQDDFQAGKTNVALLKNGVASMGYTFDRATTMIFMDRDWSVIMNEQSNSRFVPTLENAPKVPRTIIDLMCENSMDELVRNANENKWDRIQIVNNFKEWLK